MPSEYGESNLSGAGLRRLAAEWVEKTWYTPFSASPIRPWLPLLEFSTELYSMGLRRDRKRAAAQSGKLPAFVVSIGNLVAGGAGKTPFTMWLARCLAGGPHTRRVAVLSRGYGSKAAGEGIGRVPASGETGPRISRFGDEPLLMARALGHIPVWVGRKRFLSGREAIETSGAEVLLLDDGFQHRELHRDLDFVLLDAENPFGNGLLLPLGPLREPVESLSRADALVLTRANDPDRVEKTRLTLHERFPDKPVFRCSHRLSGFKIGLEGDSFPVEALGNRPVAAFAGIAHPDRFFQSLEKAGLHLCGAFPFPDHHPYRPEDLLQLLARASRTGARALVTTEKDMVRLPSEFQRFVFAAQLDLDFGPDGEPLRRYLEDRLPLPPGTREQPVA